jgi:hypothetical protein
MKTQDTPDQNQRQPQGVQRDSETPVPQKPSFLFIASVSIGVLLIILVAASSYFGLVGA